MPLRFPTVDRQRRNEGESNVSTTDAWKRAALAAGAGLAAAVLVGCSSTTGNDSNDDTVAAATTTVTTAACDANRDMAAAVRGAIADTPAPAGMTWQPNGSPTPEPYGDKVVTEGSFPTLLRTIPGWGDTASTSTDSVVTEVAPADYATPGSPGYYRWKFGTGRECAASPAGIWCSVTFPSGTPDVRNDVFTGTPNSIHLTDEGTRATLTEGGPPGAQTLPVNSRITIDGLSCTAVTDGIECNGPAGGFSFVDGELTRHGTELAPTPA